MRKRINLDITLFTVGGLGYGLIEILWRKYTHWTMIITGGICFVVLYRMFSKIIDIALWKKCILGSSVITVIEFISGCIVNLWLKLNVWDYSAMPVNLFGQVCVLYSFLWGLLTVPIVGICNLINRKIKT